MVVDAYQTLKDKNTIDFIEKNGPFKCTRKNAWLGHGHYFWDSEINWAHYWGKKTYQNKSLGYIIIKCKLNLDNKCFDIFGSVKCQKEFKEVIEVFKSNQKTKRLRELNVPNVISFMKEKEVFDYNSIRTGDMNNTYKIYFRKNREFTVINQRVQICVLHKKNVIVSPIKVVYPN